MESVHCFNCYCFPSQGVDFYVTNCMHMFCGQCKTRCDGEPTKCTECQKTNIRILKMGPDMPAQVRQMFLPIADECQQIVRSLTRVMTFQSKQRSSLMNGLMKKEAVFDRLRAAHNDEKDKKERYKKQLEQAQKLLKKQHAEIAELKSISKSRSVEAAAPVEMADETVRVFTNSMYKTPKNHPKSLPSFLKPKSMTTQLQKQRTFEDDPSYKTPQRPPKTSLGFVTPKNPPHMFPHLQKVAPQKQHSH